MRKHYDENTFKKLREVLRESLGSYLDEAVLSSKYRDALADFMVDRIRKRGPTFKHDGMPGYDINESDIFDFIAHVEKHGVAPSTASEAKP